MGNAYASYPVFALNASKGSLLYGGGGILLAALYLLSTAFPGNGPQLFALLFSAVTQGILGAAGAVYANNLLKQYSKRKEEDQDADT